MGKPDFDVAIIGGGPAGAAAAGYLAKAGVRCVVLERELFPRPHVGESFVPATTRVMRELDFIDQMDASGFPRKYGAVWRATDRSPIYDHDWEGLAPDCDASVRFEEREQAGVDKNYTWHVDRGKFDLLFLQHANRLGAEVYEGITVQRVELAAGEPSDVRFKMGRREMGVSARMVVDASGRRTFLGKQLGLRVHDPVFEQFAIHSWFDGYDRGTDRADYIWIHFLPITNTWIWQIPITESVTSVGVVTQKRHFAGRADERDAFFWKCVDSRPDVVEKLKRAEQLRPFTVEADYSYSMKQICGDGFALIGDAARFVDPIFSSGVSIAMSSARFLAGDLVPALERGDVGKASFADFEGTMRNGMRNWYEFITLYYRLNVLFTMFLRDERHRLDVLELLQGDVYDQSEPAVLKRMREVVTEVESNERHVWHRQLGDLTGKAFRPQF